VSETAVPSPAAREPAPTAREALLRHATAIFGAKGFAAASTREICEAAGVNIASIHYYFGDKQGLYREVLLRPLTAFRAEFGRFDDPALGFEQAMRMFLAPFVASAACDGADSDELHVMRLHLREMLEPTPAFREVVAQVIAPLHQAVSALLARHCGLRQADDDLHQLVFALAAMANDYCMSREFMKMLSPGVLSRPNAHEQILDRLVGYSRALLDHEIARRAAAASAPAATKRKAHRAR
jgi:TetR/AcrR family transcriptional regulator, regulator of cefoperazone and chloramphenicol sensitivity